MPEAERVATVVREWVEKAENDLENAIRVIRSGEGCPADTVCFHAQQCVEKYLKALLVWRGIPVPKTHSIRDLLTLIPATLRPRIEQGEQDRLTEYATVTRYPGDYEPVSTSEARKAIALARRVRRSVRRFLPRASTRRRTK